ncbi:MAG: Transcription-repair-coupling factor [Tenericutes bacterium ADurb.Bin087]|nr:MAG: Transcription-repair-coupling factor [Tenericutes bacterium ADurb.Bin087]
MNNFFEKLFPKNTPPRFEKERVFVTSEIIGTTFLVAEAFKKKRDNYVILTNNLYNAQKTISMLQTFIDQEDILFFPNDDLLFTEVLTATKELEAQRIYTLYSSLEKKRKYIYVVNLSAALKPTLNPTYFAKQFIELKVGNTHKMSALTTKLVELGYKNVTNVEQTMQFAKRGDIIDIYTVNEDFPTRIEFFDDEIESIRDFNVSTQVSIRTRDEVIVLPASENILLPNEQKEFLKCIHDFLNSQKKEMSVTEEEMFTNNLNESITNYLAGDYNTLNKYLLLYSLFQYNILSYIDNPNVVFANEPQLLATYGIISNHAEHYVKDQARRFNLLPKTELYQQYNTLGNYTKYITREFSEDGNESVLRISPVADLRGRDDFNLIVRKYYDDDYLIYFSINNNTQLEQVKNLLKELALDFTLDERNNEKQILITYDYFPHGFVLNSCKTVVFTSRELFNITRNEMRYNARFKAGTVIRSHEQLTAGDYVVHEYHGIGQFMEIESLKVFGVVGDYIKIKYFGNEELSIPMDQIHLIRKYSGREGVAPRLHKIGSPVWQRTKVEISKKIENIAAELVAIQAVRYQRPGFAFPPDDEFQKEFELGFPYELTYDQEIALREIKQDMEAPLIMDRLLSGDVGFGKTEIALRAAFKAISAGKQVLFLCPTTLLARQHYEVSQERFMNFGVKIAMISRLVTQKEKETIIKNFQTGDIHLLIGTHALFNIDIESVDLGLLIVDEEQRFGVEQKEIIKKMKTRVDVLTLSATPIPRTLQMSLVGIRGLSQINTAPQERMPIQTYVIKRDDYVIKELVERELGRGGQVFYLYNRIATIYHVANKLSRLVPRAKIGVVHGKMDRNDIEDVMTSFYNNDINVLVATSIIENGIDVPNANVIIVENADTFGLSQLYQIKGRVGRGNRIAYAYLLYQGNKIMNDDAKKRLQAIQEFTDLGSGYKIAQRDLMIRGAGDILGAEQSGFIDSIGIDMYLKMLEDAINEKKYKLTSDPIEKTINISGLEAYIPDDFASKSEKFDIYLEIKKSKKMKELKDFEQKVIDMYGKLPQSLEILFLKRQVELVVNSRANFIEEIKDEDVYIDILPGSAFLDIQGSLVSLNNQIGDTYRNIRFITQDGKIKLRIIKRGDWFHAYAAIVKAIVSIVRETMRVRDETR